MTDRMVLEAQAALRAGRWDEAERLLAGALSVNPRDDVALALLGELRVGQKRVQEAILAYAHAVKLRTEKAVYKERFSELARLSVAAEWNPFLADAMLACLKTPTLDCSALSRFWYSLAKAEPRFRKACDLAGGKNFDAKIDRLDAFTSPLFVHGLKRLIVHDPIFEAFICHLRRQLLDGWQRHGRQLTPLAAALALYAFHTGYILDVSEAERSAVAALRSRIEGGGEPARDSTAIAVLASYLPLCDIAHAGRIEAGFGRAGPLKDVVQEQIIEVRTQRGIAQAVPSLRAIAAGVSADVRQQYEAFPYPRWEFLDQAKLARDWQAQEATRNTERMLRDMGARILVLGCGTGRETAMLATLFPDAQITAVDLSRASLGYAQWKAQQFALANVRFYQADILALTNLDAEFDYVCVTGVLHHMRDPVAGWEICTRLLRPGGLMRVGLYSETARKDIATARAVIAERGYGSDENEMRRFRRDSPALLPDNVLDGLIRYTDYFQLSMYRDLLFHVQEHRFTLAQIAEILPRLDLQFLGFYLSNDVLHAYGSEFPDDRGRTNLGNWGLFESQHPETFRNMYIFWCRKGR